MLAGFVAAVSSSSRAALQDPDLPLPFANLEWAKGQRKRHGITGARAPAKSGSFARPRSKAASPRPSAKRARMEPAGALRSQRVTEKDIAAGRIRFPSSAKQAFPPEPATVEVTLRGMRSTARWNPRYGPDKERSGVLTVGRETLRDCVAPDDVLQVVASGEHDVLLS
jgi:hypothetical protein